jgi:membrane-bound ClpP family serine protease
MLLIILLIGLGLFLVILEIMIIPGTTVAGIAGLVLMGAGIFWMYADHGSTAGHTALGITGVASAVALAIGFKSRAWERFSNKSSMEGRANVIDEHIKVGDEGLTLSRLRPMGSVLVNGLKTEGQSNGEGIEENVTVVVTKVLPNKIIVKPKI